MDIKKIRNVILGCIVFCFFTFIYAQEDEVADYYYKIQDGKPVFTQILRWQKLEHATKYEVIVFDANKKIVETNECIQEECEVNLKPGNYFYRVGAYNILGQKEQTTNYIPFEVKKAFIPEIKSFSPDVIYIDDVTSVFTLTVPGVDESWKAYLKKGNKEIHPDKIEILNDTLKMYFKNSRNQPEEGYNIVVEHPTGLKAIVETSVDVKYKRPLSFYMNVGWDPLLLLFPKSAVKDVYKKRFFPVSGKLTFGLIVLKRSYGFFGAEFSTNFRMMTPKKPSVAVNSFVNITALDLIYEYHFTNKLFGLLTFGGGLNSIVEFEGKPKYIDMPFLLKGGAGIRWQFHPRVHCGFTVSWTHLIYNPALSGLVPELYVGFRY